MTSSIGWGVPIITAAAPWDMNYNNYETCKCSFAHGLYGHQPIEGAIIAVVGRERWKSPRDIAREMGLSQPRVLWLLLDAQLHPYPYLRNAHMFQYDRPLHSFLSYGVSARIRVMTPPPSFHPSVLSIFCHRLPVPYMKEGDCILLYVVLPPATWCSYWPISSETSS